MISSEVFPAEVLVPNLFEICAQKIDPSKMSAYEIETILSRDVSKFQTRSKLSELVDFAQTLLKLKTFEERNVLIERYLSGYDKFERKKIEAFVWMHLIRNIPDQFTTETQYTKASLKVAQKDCYIENLNLYYLLTTSNPGLKIGFHAVWASLALNRPDFAEHFINHEMLRREESDPFACFPIENNQEYCGCDEKIDWGSVSLGPDIINSTDPFDRTLLNRVMDTYTSIETIEYLVVNGADLDAFDQYGRSPLFYAALLYARSGHSEKFNFLLENGANINLKNRYGRTFLHEVVYYSDTNSLQLGVSPVSHRNDVSKMLRLLVDHGADMALPDSQGRSVIEYAGSSPSFRNALETLTALERR